MPAVAKANLAKLGIELPVAAAPAANYIPYNFSCGQLYISGQIPKDASGKLMTGQLGNLGVEEGQKAARTCAIAIAAQLQAALGDLDRVKKIVKITCFVNSTSSFTEQHLVANGASDFFVELFGPEVGRHTRSAFGVAQIPMNAAVEVEAVVEIEGTL